MGKDFFKKNINANFYNKRQKNQNKNRKKNL